MRKMLILLLVALLHRLDRALAASYFESLAVRQQLAVLNRKTPRPRLHPPDRWFWVLISSLWPDWRDALAIVKPATVIRLAHLSETQKRALVIVDNKLAENAAWDEELLAQELQYATSIGGSVTGRGGDLILIDDPMKPEEAMSELKRDAVNQWFDGTL